MTISGGLLRRSLLSLLLWTALARGGDTDPPAVFGCPIPTPPPLTRTVADAPSADGAISGGRNSDQEAGPDTIDIVSGDMEVDLNGPSSFNDRLVLRQGNRQFGADGGRYDPNTGEFAATGNVEFLDPATWVRGSNARYNSTTGLFSIEDAEYDLFTVPARGSADRISVEGTRQLALTDVTYTSCARGDNDWMLHAGSLSVDRTTGTATARNARLEFLGVPILYTPYLTYPIDSRRKSGLLLPEVGSSEQRGVEYEQPYYFNLAPNYDATLTPHYMSKRGVQAQGEFRYLGGGTSGILSGDFLPNDEVTGENRTQLVWFNQSQLPAGWRSTIDATDVSDSTYYEDLTSGLANTSQVVLTRSVAFERFGKSWSTLLQVEDYEMLDQSLTPEEQPYREVPRLAVNGYWPNAGFGLALGVASELTYFDRATGVTGLRAHVQPEASLPLDLGPLRIEPYVGFDHTVYSLNHVAPDGNDAPSTTVPIYSLDLRTLLDRTWGDGGKWLQTIEPRVQYVYVPFRDQNEFPVFDTIQPDFSLVQLFRRNRYVGLDRFGDTNQLNLGLTTRMLRSSDGSQFLTATIGETQYFSSQDVVLPGEQPSDDTASDYIAELGMNLNDQWKVDLGYQWDSDLGVTQLAEARVLYRADDYRVVNLSYRFRKDSVREIDLAGAWPLGDRWNIVGHYDYSLLDNEPLERLVGLDYSTCCWGIRLVAIRSLTSRDGGSDSAISLQLLLKGFGSSRSPAESLLGRGILGDDSFDRY
jgi:LPS-assembly protein